MAKAKKRTVTIFQIIGEAKQTGASHYLVTNPKEYRFYRDGQGLVATFSSDTGWVAGDWTQAKRPPHALKLLKN